MRYLRSFEGLSLAAGASALFAIVVVPFLLMLYFSLTDVSLLDGAQSLGVIGFQNFREMANDQRLWESVSRTVIYTSVAVPIELVGGLGLALLVPVNRRWTRWAIGLIATPTILSGISVGLMWRLLLNGDFGIVPFALSRIGLYEGSILGSGLTAFLAIVVVDIWQWTPFCALILLAGRLAIPGAEFSAARLDGAGRARLLWHITLPRLMPSLGLCVLFRAADCLREFDKIVAMTNGGPGASTELVTLYIWNVAFGHGRLGYGSAIAASAYIVTLCLAAGWLWSLKPGVQR